MTFNPKYSGYAGKKIKNYRKFLGQQIRPDEKGVEHLYRSQAYDILGAQQNHANRLGSQMLGATFGFNNPTGLDAALQRRTSLEADYAGANLASLEAARKAKIQAGQALEASKQNQVNWYTPLEGLYLGKEFGVAGLNQQAAAADEAADLQKWSLVVNGLGGILGGVAGGLV